MPQTFVPLESNSPNWFVLFVRANQEKQTAQRLAAYDIEHFLPRYRSVRQWKDRRVSLEMPLFPGYVFVRLPLLEKNKVITLPNVVGLVGSKNTPAIVSMEEIDSIKRGVEFGNAAPHPAPVAGQSVMITSGVLQGMQGTLLRSQNSTRVVIAIDSIARRFVVEVDISCLKPLGAVLPQEPRLASPHVSGLAGTNPDCPAV